MKFNEFQLEQTLIDNLQKNNYIDAFPVQEQVIPYLLEHKNVVVQAKTGSGKTASFAIPIIQNVIQNEKKAQALILSPTRELALQIKGVFDQLGSYKLLKSLAIYGKFPYRYQVQDLKQRVHVICGTPGRILDHIKNGTIDLSNIAYLVIDEADLMLSMGFIEEVKQILQHVNHNKTMALFSATMSEEIQILAQDYISNMHKISLEDKIRVHEHIEHYAYSLSTKAKFTTLLQILSNKDINTAIIFANRQEQVDALYDQLLEYTPHIRKIHGGMMQNDRLQSLDDFRVGKARILIASDVLARGIDLEAVSYVINYDFPIKKENFVHRLGRTARKDTHGKAISLLTYQDQKLVSEVEEYLQTPLQVHHKLPNNEVDLTHLQQCLEIKQVEASDVLTLYINAGKAKKVRPGDIAGAISKIEGIQYDDVGIIQVQDHQSYVDILHNKGELVLTNLHSIKGKKVKVEIKKA